jgi:hypothetical protein
MMKKVKKTKKRRYIISEGKNKQKGNRDDN